jgi:hypothetical protein
MNNDPRYTGVALMLPQVLPPLTMADALKAYRRLVWAFGGKADIPVGVLEARGGRRITTNRRQARRCWASTTPTSSHLKGWGRLIHDASHYVFEKRYPSARPHDGGHAQLECKMAHYVASRGMLADYPATKPKATKRKTYAERIAHTNALMARWETKAKRAATALRKLKRRVRALERAAKTVTYDTLVSSYTRQNTPNN